MRMKLLFNILLRVLIRVILPRRPVRAILGLEPGDKILDLSAEEAVIPVQASLMLVPTDDRLLLNYIRLVEQGDAQVEGSFKWTTGSISGLPESLAQIARHGNQGLFFLVPVGKLDQKGAPSGPEFGDGLGHVRRVDAAKEGRQDGLLAVLEGGIAGKLEPIQF